MPVAEGEGHTVGNVPAHLGVGSTVTSHVHSLSILGHGGREGCESGSAAVEVNLNMEWSGGVDLGSWTVLAGAEFVLGVLPAGTGSVAVVVVSLVVWSIARVWSSLVSKLVGLHNVELWAVSSTNLVGITVPETVISASVVTALVLSWHADSVEGSNASALHLGEVNIVLN